MSLSSVVVRRCPFTLNTRDTVRYCIYLIYIIEAFKAQLASQSNAKGKFATRLTMSLFGSSPVESSPANAPARPQSKSLFDDESTPGNATSSSLFADEANDNTASPWGLPTPKKAARGELVKSLLPDSDVPESYIDAFDTVLNSGERSGEGVNISAVKKILGSSRLSLAEQTRLLNLVAPGHTESTSLGRSEFNVLIALIGLSQEEEEATLDGVDERKKSETSNGALTSSTNEY